MAIDTATTDQGARPGALTARGEAMAALIRFEDLFRELGPADRAWFADELADLAEEADGTRRCSGAG